MWYALQKYLARLWVTMPLNAWRLITIGKSIIINGRSKNGSDILNNLLVDLLVNNITEEREIM